MIKIFKTWHVRLWIISLLWTTGPVQAETTLAPLPVQSPSSSPGVEPLSTPTPPPENTPPRATARHSKFLVADLGSATPEIGLQLFYNGSFLSNQNSNQFFTQNGYYDTAANGSQTPANPSVSAIGIMFDYQPNFLKFFGIFDFGVSGAINPIFPTPNNTVTGLLAGATVGGQIRYQLNYFKNQPLIPIVGYFADWMTYGFTALNTSNQTINGAIVVKGPLVGAWLLLNWIEPSSSRDMYLNTGISRTYFTFEMRQMSGSSGTLTITGQTYLFGLRFEF